ncbi:DUF938 domain-containing protein [Seongchinamella sediminis]|uniref:DUF938 domain-containing protein n=1 Tax=Seongchinamella sediminis TaxID=2283635 RepID=A0A3L7DTF4_9GAMM|nr:DUF938 domain-containing protein [Seongchinamella sediminis]RLQ20887.1 DUF938 domain-containing protein [Seongchinamella sediminis]
MDSLPFSQACENNKGPILAVLAEAFADRTRVLEIAAGTGQHACWFAGHLPQLQWQPTELAQNLPVLAPRCGAYDGANLLPPCALDVSSRPWPCGDFPDAVFTANSLHIMPWDSVQDLFAELGARAAGDTLLAIYGPFNYRGQYTSDSNARFDQWLAQQSRHSAIRDFEQVDALAVATGFALEADAGMPANNRLLLWRKA